VIGASTLLLTNHLVVRYLYRHERLDRLVEGRPDALIEHGAIRTERLQKELITLDELLSAARKQGFDSLGDIDEAILDPGGAILFHAKKPGPELERHAALIARLDRIQAELAELRTRS
jgi:uncharacterized membrane protein YcaP (DUF421 family)